MTRANVADKYPDLDDKMPTPQWHVVGFDDGPTPQTGLLDFDDKDQTLTDKDGLGDKGPTSLITNLPR